MLSKDLRLFVLVLFAAIVSVPATARAQTSTPRDANPSTDTLQLGHRADATSCFDTGAGAAGRWAGTSHGNEVRLVPRLTLVGFSGAGCAGNAGVGATLVYVVPLAPKLSLPLSIGVAYMHRSGAFGNRSFVTPSARADLLFKLPEGRRLDLGFGTAGIWFGGRM
jgi:hypothetical protein